MQRDTTFIDLDKAIALGLYLAYFLPPHLDAMPSRGVPIAIAIRVEGEELVMQFDGLAAVGPLGALRQRLLDAYIRQLRAEVAAQGGGTLLRLPLYGTVSALSQPAPRTGPASLGADA